jgi:cupin 2 domain-containing protein
LAVTAAVMLVVTDNRRYEIGLLVICVWAVCRLYYFFFYVLDHYAGGDKYASVFAMVVKLCRNQKVTVTPTQPAVGSHATNLFADLPQHLPEELIEILAMSQHVRIERIVSTGQSSPEEFWYDQPEHEWVVVLQGDAVIEFEKHSKQLSSGDYVLIPPHQKHRVASTSCEQPTVWVAVFF